MMQGTAYILVRSVVPNPNDRKAFDYWYWSQTCMAGHALRPLILSVRT